MNRIEIMRTEPVVRFEDAVFTIAGRPGDLLRLLALHEGRVVLKETIAALHCVNRSDANVASVSSKIRDLRKQLRGACDLVQACEGRGYRAALDGWTVDALEFCASVRKLDPDTLGDGINPVDEAVALGEIDKANAALTLWKGNPAHEIRDAAIGEVEFEKQKVKAESHRLRAQLLTGRPDYIREAIQELLHRTRTTADEADWHDLLLACDALSSPAQVKAVIDQISAHYVRNMPEALKRAIAAINDGCPLPNPYRRHALPMETALPVDSGIADTNDQNLQSVARLCAMLGITTASQRRLAGDLRPLSCIRRTRRRLYFSGVLASKWVLEPAVRAEFDRLLTRLDEDNGDVRFLIIDPHSDGFRRLDALRQGAISTESVPPLLKLAAAHSSLEVRGYSHLPAFRIVIIDDEVVSFSPYRLAADSYLATDRGWEAPHIVLDPLAEYPLAEAFQLLFEETWKNSKRLGMSK